MHFKTQIFKTQMFAGLALLLCAAPAFGHHSFAMFDQTKTMRVSGTVADYNWMNPHTWIHVTVADGQGNSVTWSFEASSTGRLSASGWSPDMVAVGDSVEVEFNPLRDGTPGGQVRTLHLSNGTELCNGAECRERLGLPE